MKNYPLVCIITLTWDSKDLIKSCFDSLYKLTDYPNYKVIIVENGSSKDCVEFSSKSYKKADVLWIKKNRGFVGGVNFGMKYVLKKYSPDYVLLLSNDMKIIQNDWLDKLIEVAESEKYIGIVGPKIISPSGRIYWAGRKLEKNIFYLIFQTLSASLNPGVGVSGEEASFVGAVNTISGSCMMIKKDLIKKIGLLDISLAPSYQEDVEYSFRAWKNKYKVFYVGTSKVLDSQGYTYIRKGRQNEKLYLALRNSIIVCKRYFGFEKTFLIGLPVVFFATFFERKNKSLGFSFRNLKLRNDLLFKIIVLIKAVKYLFK
jgi:GT2 family glycosyltransferase